MNNEKEQETKWEHTKNTEDEPGRAARSQQTGKALENCKKHCGCCSMSFAYQTQTRDYSD